MQPSQPISTLLVVDDDEPNLAIARAILAAAGHTVVTCNDGKHALDIALDYDQQIDGIVLDVCLPSVSGLDVARSLRADPRTHNLPIVCLSALAQADETRDGLDAGCDIYVTKPYKRRELLDAVEGAFRRRGLNGLPAR